MQYKIKTLTIALRYNMQGQPIQWRKVDLPEPVEIHPYTLNVPKGKFTGTAKVETSYGKYKIDIEVDNKTGAMKASYVHPLHVPAPMNIEVEKVA